MNDKHKTRRPGYEAKRGSGHARLSASLRAAFHLRLWVALLLSVPCVFPAAG